MRTLNEKILAALMKAAYKGGGLKVWRLEWHVTDCLMLSSGFWTVLMAMDDMPGKALGLLAEWMRHLPLMNEAYLLQHKQEPEELNVQHEGYMPFGQGRANEMFEDPKILEIAAKYGKTPRQVALRYQIQCGVIVIPKSVNPERVRANADVFDFALSDQDMAALRSMDMEKPLTGDPETPERTMKITGFKL